jgi:hypothetical protein
MKIVNFYKSKYRMYSIGVRSRTNEFEADDSCARATLWLGNYVAALKLPNCICPPDRWQRFNEFTQSYCIEITEREYSLSFIEDTLVLHYGSNPFQEDLYEQTPKVKRKSWLLPWKDWRAVKFELLEPDLKLYAIVHADEGERLDCLRSKVPKLKIVCIDYDGIRVNAEFSLEDTYFILGRGRFAWLGWLTRAKVVRRVDVNFDREVGKGKESWKGGMLACSWSIDRNVSLVEASRNFLTEHNLQII